MGMNDTIRARSSSPGCNTVFQIFDTLDAAQQASGERRQRLIPARTGLTTVWLPPGEQWLRWPR